jgi:ribulose-5-phosphate 4-epimerase/fuculose-1-phosphate aldolase
MYSSHGNFIDRSIKISPTYIGGKLYPQGKNIQIKNIEIKSVFHGIIATGPNFNQTHRYVDQLINWTQLPCKCSQNQAQ